MIHHDRKTCPDAQEWLDGKQIEPLNLCGNENVADLIDHVFADSGFNARRLAEGAQLYRRMTNSLLHSVDRARSAGKKAEEAAARRAAELSQE